MIKHYNIEKLFLIGTNKSMWDNINENFNGEENYQLDILEKKENNTLKESDLELLNKTIDKGLNSTGSKCYIVKDGETEEELWKIFDKFLKILNEINGEDELYIDITHLFRSLSVMSVIITEFGKTYKNFNLSGVFYGMLKRDEPSNIINLIMFFELLDWSRAIQNLKQYGNSFELMKLINKSNEDTTVKNAFINFSNAISISDIGAIQGSIKQLKGNIKLYEEHDKNIFKIISNDLKKFITRFDIGNLSKFQLELSKWYCENKNFAMAYITLSEATVSIMCEKLNIDVIDKNSRNEAQKELFNYAYFHSKSNDKDKIYKAYSKINNIRNSIAHKLSANSSKNKSSPKDSIGNITLYFKTIESLYDI